MTDDKLPIHPEDREVTLTEEQSAALIKKAGHLTCIACPYFRMYGVDVQIGFVGRCDALYELGVRRGGLRGRVMKFLSRYMWTMIVDNCTHARRYERALNREAEANMKMNVNEEEQETKKEASE